MWSIVEQGRRSGSGGKALDLGVHIAVVDDDPGLRASLGDMLQSAGYRPLLFADACSLLGALDEAIPMALIILDLALPDQDGIAVAGLVRARSQTPIIMLTGRGEEADRIVGLEIGADDYVVKPFNVRELLARVRAVLRRAHVPLDDAPSISVRRGYSFADKLLDADTRRLFDRNGRRVALTVAEFDLLLAFLSHPRQLLSRNQLLDLLPSSNEHVFDRTVDVLVLRLRRKIEPNPAQPQLIRTERGRGYIFDAPVLRLAEAA